MKELKELSEFGQFTLWYYGTVDEWYLQFIDFFASNEYIIAESLEDCIAWGLEFTRSGGSDTSNIQTAID